MIRSMADSKVGMRIISRKLQTRCSVMMNRLMRNKNGVAAATPSMTNSLLILEFTNN